MGGQSPSPLVQNGPDFGGNAPLLPPHSPGKPCTKSRGLWGIKTVLLAGVVVQNAALSVAARWSRVEAELRTAEGECASSPRAIVLVVEIVKIALSLALFAWEAGLGPAGALGELARVTAGAPAECAKVLVPAVTYVVQNNLLLVAAANLEGPVLALFGQLKILTTALFSVALLGRALGGRRWIALLVLTAAIATVQLSQLKTPEGAGDAGSKNMPLGLATTVAVASLSGFAGVYFEKVLKGSPISVWVRNIHLAAFSVVTSGVAVFSVPSRGGCGPMDGFGPVCWLYVAVQAAGGLLIAAVIKFADNILKAFATSVAIVVVALVSAAFFGFHLSGLFWVGASGVIYAVFLYGDLLKDLGPCRNCPPWLGGPVAVAESIV
mmetsp:Transcript_17113/g.51076  ORF Transcript_17113/g.51076 Transcript_17113/m.51076 type:complete len:380 (+) Transcript_17113:335-1474(+)